jgi:guanylate kinase
VEELERRLQNRATEDASTIRTRLDRAQEELQYETQFDAVIVNDSLESAVTETLGRVRQFLNG